MNLQFITDTNGHKNGVLLTLKDWEKIQKDLNEFGKLKDKKKFFEGLGNAFNEVAMIKQGKKKPNSFDILLNEI